MLEAFIDCFWEIATQAVQVIIPILALFLVFRLIHDVLWRD